MHSSKYKILNALAKGSISAVGIFLVTCSPYGGKVLIKELKESDLFRDYQEKMRARRKFSVYVRRLKSDGLIEVDGFGKDRLLKITAKGEKWLVKNRQYDVKRSSSMTMVSFDIPEKERSKRDWLREAISNMGLKPVQKSVWAGKCLIPIEFINDLKKLNIYQYVDISGIEKVGSFKRLDD